MVHAVPASDLFSAASSYPPFSSQAWSREAVFCHRVLSLQPDRNNLLCLAAEFSAFHLEFWNKKRKLKKQGIS